MEARRSRAAARGEQDQRTVSGDATRKRILKSAERLFAKSGIDAVSIRDITDAAGVNTAAIHYHFGSKSGLIEALLARWSSAVDGCWIASRRCPRWRCAMWSRCWCGR